MLLVETIFFKRRFLGIKVRKGEKQSSASEIGASNTDVAEGLSSIVAFYAMLLTEVSGRQLSGRNDKISRFLVKCAGHRSCYQDFEYLVSLEHTNELCCLGNPELENHRIGSAYPMRIATEVEGYFAKKVISNSSTPYLNRAFVR